MPTPVDFLLMPPRSGVPKSNTRCAVYVNDSGDLCVRKPDGSVTVLGKSGEGAAGRDGRDGAQGMQGPPGAGEPGPKGDSGAPGQDGTAATISIGTVATGEPGTQASVTNSGSESAAVLDFVIPKGDAGSGGGSFKPVPDSPDSPGELGDFAVDAGSLYVYTPDSIWKRAELMPLSPIELTYANDGDENGVFHFLGRVAGRTEFWANPHLIGQVIVSSNGNNSGSDRVETIVDRIGNSYSTTTLPGGGWVQVNLGASRLLALKRYSYRFRSDITTFTPTGWTVLGSNDGINFTLLDTQTAQTPALNKWVSPVVAGPVSAYRYIRIKMTGNNNSGTSQFSIGEWELYGTLSF